MTTAAPPLLWMLIGPNGAGKTTYYRRQLAPRLRAPFINADIIQREELPGSGMDAAYEAAQRASQQRQALMNGAKSFVTETVASHPSKLELLQAAKARGYEVWVSFLYLESADLSVRRVARRVRQGGHPVPEEKVRARYARMAPIAVEAVRMADRGFLIDNSDSRNPLRTVMLTERGRETWRHRRPPEWLERLLP